MSKTEDLVKEIGTPIAEKLGFELAKVEYLKEGKNWFLRLYIDRTSGISLDDCVAYSEKMGEALDSLDPDPIPQAYFLEVSSLGVERPLETDEDFNQSVGKYIMVTLHETVEGQSMYQGDLIEATEEEILIKVRVKTREKNISIQKSNIARAQLTVKL